MYGGKKKGIHSLRLCAERKRGGTREKSRDGLRKETSKYTQKPESGGRRVVAHLFLAVK